jgi:hypothetical protein
MSRRDDMSKVSKKELVKQVIMGAREYGISSVLFRNIIGERLGVNVTDMGVLVSSFTKA